jgi:hypothetical protein
MPTGRIELRKREGERGRVCVCVKESETVDLVDFWHWGHKQLGQVPRYPCVIVNNLVCVNIQFSTLVDRFSGPNCMLCHRLPNSMLGPSPNWVQC